MPTVYVDTINKLITLYQRISSKYPVTFKDYVTFIAQDSQYH